MLFGSSLQKILNSQPEIMATCVVSLEGLVVETVVRDMDESDQNGEFSDVAVLLGRLVTREKTLNIGAPLSLRIMSTESILMIRRFSDRYALALRGHTTLDLGRASQMIRLELPNVARHI